MDLRNIIKIRKLLRLPRFDLIEEGQELKAKRSLFDIDVKTGLDLKVLSKNKKYKILQKIKHIPNDSLMTNLVLIKDDQGNQLLYSSALFEF